MKNLHQCQVQIGNMPHGNIKENNNNSRIWQNFFFLWCYFWQFEKKTTCNENTFSIDGSHDGQQRVT